MLFGRFSLNLRSGTYELYCRKPGSNMQKLKSLLGMIFQDSLAVILAACRDRSQKVSGKSKSELSAGCRGVQKDKIHSTARVEEGRSLCEDLNISNSASRVKVSHTPYAL